ncbi:hypothetical protein PUNSTDRAFT_133688 [Punctularia strigosozonata HHB-11173 SS5]|uniref:uncharacterized protein n=1 Tax=Punctularia strigosozonata (strain HHB-11173) TaxID=741275 RepID=UPI0004418112|nr:uncharacterized protein PUNSTDRAFT_133688 [Punctularia strigosozonata HHB-11173 SS5]EIN09915.1 hypothetical protein PUNSTDRAFT_133688 [Punctularia strigosozonata HHB-11173 SS5]
MRYSLIVQPRLGAGSKQFPELNLVLADDRKALIFAPSPEDVHGICRHLRTLSRAIAPDKDPERRILMYRDGCGREFEQLRAMHEDPTAQIVVAVDLLAADLRKETLKEHPELPEGLSGSEELPTRGHFVLFYDRRDLDCMFALPLQETMRILNWYPAEALQFLRRHCPDDIMPLVRSYGDIATDGSLTRPEMYSLMNWWFPAWKCYARESGQVEELLGDRTKLCTCARCSTDVASMAPPCSCWRCKLITTPAAGGELSPLPMNPSAIKPANVRRSRSSACTQRRVRAP